MSERRADSARERRADIAIVGAGAAGLWAAAAAARRGRRVVLVEKTPRTGTKILASGGTRCNLTTTLGPRPAARLFGAGAAERFVLPAFEALPPERVRRHFHALGVPTVTEDALEKVFPASQRAVDVRDALERDARAAGVEVVLGAPVVGVGRAATGEWAVEARAPAPSPGEDAGRLVVTAPRLILCSGGMSYPRAGTTGDGYRWLADLGLPVVPPVPALVPLTSPARWVRELTGIALQSCEARLLDATGVELGRRRRPVLFTHDGVSGPAAMDLSIHVARAALVRPAAGAAAAAARAHVLALDLLPDLDREALRARVIDAAASPGAPRLARVVPELPRRVLAAVAAEAGLGGDNPPLNGLSRAARHALVEALKGLPVPVDGTLGFDKAEVTAGGLALDAVDRKTLRVRDRAGLYVIGELLDLQGPIGGLNFQAAFACGELAGTDAARA